MRAFDSLQRFPVEFFYTFPIPGTLEARYLLLWYENCVKSRQSIAEGFEALVKAKIGFMASLVFLWVGGVSASVIYVDPGAVGSAATNPLTSTAISGTATFDYVFSDMKHVDAETFGFVLATADAFDTGCDCDFRLDIEFFLSDMFGERLFPEPEPASLRLTVPGNQAFPDGAVIEAVYPVDVDFPVLAHDIHIQVTDSAGLLSRANWTLSPFVTGIVGEWEKVPLPSTLALFALGLLAMRRRTA